MIKNALVSAVGVLACAGSLSASAGEPDPVPTKRLIACLVEVESHGDLRAIGDAHLRNKAYGPLQVRKPACDDVNRRFGTAYAPEQCLGNLEVSTDIFRKYMKMYATERRLGHAPTDADCARIWNGGPDGWKKSSTEPYLEKVRKAGL